MKIPRISPLTGRKTVRDIPIDKQDFLNWYDGYMPPKMLRKRNPQLTDIDMEFLRSGLTEHDWATLGSPQPEPIDYEILPQLLEKNYG